MGGIFVKLNSLVEDGKWETKSEKYVNILALTSQIQELKILFAKQSTFQERKKKNNGGNNRVNNIGSSWKTFFLESSESWMKDKNRHTWHW